MQFIQQKRESFRCSIRQQYIEQKFKEKRLFDSFQKEDDHYTLINKQLMLNVENYGLKLIQNEPLMQELLSQPQEYQVLLSLCNISSSESNTIIDRLIHNYYLHILFMDLLKQNQKISNNVATIIQGLANLFFSEFKFMKQPTIYILQNEIIPRIIKYSEQIEKNDSENMKYYLVRLSIAIFRQIKHFKLESYLTSPQIVDIFTICIKWFDACQDNCAIVIIYACNYLNGLLEIVEDQKIVSFFNAITIQMKNQNLNSAALLLEMIRQILITGHHSQIVQILDNSNFDQIIKSCFKTYHQQLIQQALNIIKIFSNSEYLELQSFADVLFEDIIQCLEETQDSTNIIQCVQILNDIQNNSNNSNHLQIILDLFFEKCQYTQMSFNEDVSYQILLKLQEIIANDDIILNEKQQRILEQLSHVNNQQISSLSESILQILDN